MGDYNPPFTITNSMLSYVAAISEKIGRITIISDMETKPHLRKNNRIRSIHSSLKIEANSLSVEQVRDVINGKLVLGELKEIQEVKNAYDAYERISEINPYSIADLKRFHGIMTKYIVDESGGFRHGEEGVFNGENLSATFRMTTKIQRTSDEYGIALNELIWHQGFEKSDIDACIVASVVPDIMHSLGSAMIKYFGIKPIVVSAGIKTGLKIKTENPKQVGADRIVDAVAAYTLHGGPVIVIDYGTATTYDVVGADGTFEAAVIAPGIRTSAQAMWNQAAMLPAVEIKKPESILAKETISCMQAGIVFGQIGQTEYIVKKIKEESGYVDAKVVASGGLGKIIANETDIIDVYDPQLTLKGLRMIYEKNKR